DPPDGIPIGRINLLGREERQPALAEDDRADRRVGTRRREVLPVAERGGNLVVAADDPETTVAITPRDRAVLARLDPRFVGLNAGDWAEQIEVVRRRAIPHETRPSVSDAHDTLRRSDHHRGHGRSCASVGFRNAVEPLVEDGGSLLEKGGAAL